MNKKICYIISNLDIGGAELSLLKIIDGLSVNYNFTIISFKKIGIVGERLNKKGFNVISLELDNLIFLPTKLFLLYRIIKDIKPQIVHTWMYHADFFGSIVSRIAGVKIIYWNIRNTELIKGTSYITKLIGYINSPLSYCLPNKIILVSESSKKYHSSLFYCKNKMIVIPNGYDTNEYKYNSIKRLEIRSKLNIPKTSIIVGSIGRFNSYKDHNTFIEAAINLLYMLDEEIDIRFVLIGKDINEHNLFLMKKISDSKYKDKFHLLGSKLNVIDFYSAFDIFCLHSKSEGFPNVLAEAMACGLFCISTDVGDVRLIIKEDEFIVEPNNSLLLANCLLKATKLTKQKMLEIGEKNKNLINNFYSLKKLYDNYEEIYKI